MSNIGNAGAAVGDLDLDLLVVELAGAQFAAHGLARLGAGVGADERIDDAFLGVLFGARA